MLGQELGRDEWRLLPLGGRITGRTGKWQGCWGMISELDALHAAMQAGGEAEGLAFYRALADAELFVLLEAEAEGEVMTPRVFDLAEGTVLLAFDSEERLAGFADGPLPYAALPGRVIAGQMVRQGPGFGIRLSLGLNLGSGAASEVVLPPEAMDWLMQMLNQPEPEARNEVILGFEAPVVPQALLQALPAALTGASRAYLVGVRYKGGRRDQLLALTGVNARAEAKVARAVNEALAFSGIEAGALDLAFVTAGDAVFKRMEGVALIIAPLSKPEAPRAEQAARGRDGGRPPKLR